MFFSRENIAHFLCKEFKTQKDRSIDAKYRFACALLTSSKNSNKKAGLRILEEVANQPLKQGGQLENNKIKTTSRFFKDGLDMQK